MQPVYSQSMQYSSLLKRVYLCTQTPAHSNTIFTRWKSLYATACMLYCNFSAQLAKRPLLHSEDVSYQKTEDSSRGLTVCVMCLGCALSWTELF